MKITGKSFMDIMCDINPEYRKCIIIENGKEVLYVQVLRSIYGCIEAALQWYKCYTEVLEKEGFVLNPYDRCVANKMIDGHQCTIAWYVDDNVITHQNDKVLDDVFKKICNCFGDMKLNTGDEHDFLGMKIKLHREDKKIELGMEDQI